MTERPFYESSADLAVEWFDCMAFCLMINSERERDYLLSKIETTAGEHTPDYWVKNEQGKPVAAVEYKNRSYPFEQVFRMGGYMLSRAKYEALMNLFHEYRIRPALLVRFLDGLRFLPLSGEHQVTFGKGGRTDRGDPLDQEEVAFIGRENWKPVPELE